MGMARSTFYDAPAMSARDIAIVAEIQAICDTFDAYGYRRIGAELRPRDIATVGEIHQPCSKFRRHVFDRPADTRLLSQDLPPGTNSLDGPSGGIDVFWRQEAVEPLRIAKRLRRPDQT